MDENRAERALRIGAAGLLLEGSRRSVTVADPFLKAVLHEAHPLSVHPMGCAHGRDEECSRAMTEAKSQAPTDHELAERFAGLRERWDELRGRL